MATAIYTDCDGLEVDGGLEEREGGVCHCTALQTSSLLFFVVVVGLFFGTRSTLGRLVNTHSHSLRNRNWVSIAFRARRHDKRK